MRMLRNAIIALVMFIGPCGYDPYPSRPAVPQVNHTQDGWHTVQWTYDGDTIRLDTGVVVRLIGINAPEAWPVWEPCAYAAKQQMFAYGANPVYVVEGEGTTVDPYGRTLAYVWSSAGVFINEAMVRQGNARVTIYPSQGNSVHNSELWAAQTASQAENGCVWQ